MSYVKTINALLKPSEGNGLKVLDLFAGAGGLALGFEARGFETVGFEMNDDCCETYKSNLNNPCHKLKITSDSVFPNADVIVGGPPCQPFSVRGKQKGVSDERNGFPAFIEAVKKVKPKLFLIENVRGLMYRNKPYLNQVVEELSGLGYQVDYELFDLSKFGVPQKRLRVVIVGHFGGFSFPEPSQEIVTAGEAIGDLLDQPIESPKYLTQSMDEYIARYEAKSKCRVPRDLHLDRPARTLTCRNLAGSTSDMHRVALDDGRRRRITTREAARLQSFPDHFEFKGAENSIYYQIGNAVPPLFAYHLAGKVQDYFKIYN